MLHEKINWLVIADGGQARVFHYMGHYTQLHQVAHMTHPHPLNHEEGPDKPGRTFASATLLKHAYEPKTDWHDRQKKDFMDTLADMVIKAHRDKAFAKVTLVCPAHLIGLLRDKIHTHIHTHDIHMECLPKDYTHLNKDEIHAKLLEAGLSYA